MARNKATGGNKEAGNHKEAASRRAATLTKRGNNGNRESQGNSVDPTNKIVGRNNATNHKEEHNSVDPSNRDLNKKDHNRDRKEIVRNKTAAQDQTDLTDHSSSAPLNKVVHNPAGGRAGHSVDHKTVGRGQTGRMDRRRKKGNAIMYDKG